MSRALCLVFTLLSFTLIGGCSDYIEGYYFTPNPALAQVFPPPSTQPSQPLPPAVEGMSSIVGVHREVKKEGIPTSVQVRLRLENNGPEAMSFDPQSMELYDGGGLKFQAPVVGDAHAFTLSPMQSLDVEAFFPFALGHSYDTTDLRLLRLRWIVQIHGQSVVQEVEFHRIHRAYYYDPYWDYPPPFYGRVGGAVVVHVR